MAAILCAILSTVVHYVILRAVPEESFYIYNLIVLYYKDTVKKNDANPGHINFLPSGCFNNTKHMI